MSEKQTPTGELASMTRMFNAACADLCRINEALSLDPDDGSAEPILEAIASLTAERDELKQDAARLDWLADTSNNDGQVLLPGWAVEANLDSMRAAIDAVMKKGATHD